MCLALCLTICLALVSLRDYTLHPSISALFIAKNSLKNFSGFSGSLVAKCFIASSRCGVTCWFRYTRVGLPCGIGCVGACCGPVGCGEFRDDAGAGGAGVGVGAETGAEVGTGCDSVCNSGCNSDCASGCASGCASERGAVWSGACWIVKRGQLE